MNREIEFRGMTHDHDKWVYGFLFYRDNEFVIQQSEPIPPTFSDPSGDLDNYEFYEIIPETIGQYIGLKDTNERKIYKGDIDQRGYVIKWDPLHCRWALFDGDNCVGDLIADIWDEKGKPPKLWQDSSIEIVGNEFENLELMQHDTK